MSRAPPENNKVREFGEQSLRGNKSDKENYH
jgi:hypothetical protein